MMKWLRKIDSIRTAEEYATLGTELCRAWDRGELTEEEYGILYRLASYTFLVLANSMKG